MIAQAAQAIAQQFQPLHWVDGVHGPFERQMDIVVIKQVQRLVEQQRPLL